MTNDKKLRSSDIAVLLLLVLILANIVTVIMTCVAIGKVNAVLRSNAEDAQEATVAPAEPSATVYTYETENAPETPSDAPESTPEVTEAPTVEWQPNPWEVDELAKALWGECRGVKSKAEQAAVAWCVLNRVDDPRFPNTILEVLNQPYQFSGYDISYPVTEYLEALARDVMIRWHNEKEGASNVGRTLPQTYCYFTGDGTRNNFTVEWRSSDFWDWSLPDPYAA